MCRQADHSSSALPAYHDPHGGSGMPSLYRNGALSEEILEAVATDHHHRNFAAAIRGEISGKPLTNFDYSGPMTETVLLGTVAIRLPGETLRSNEGTFSNSEAANQMIHDPYRKGWEVTGI